MYVKDGNNALHGVRSKHWRRYILVLVPTFFWTSYGCTAEEISQSTPLVIDLKFELMC